MKKRILSASLALTLLLLLFPSSALAAPEEDLIPMDVPEITAQPLPEQEEEASPAEVPEVTTLPLPVPEESPAPVVEEEALPAPDAFLTTEADSLLVGETYSGAFAPGNQPVTLTLSLPEAGFYSLTAFGGVNEEIDFDFIHSQTHVVRSYALPMAHLNLDRRGIYLEAGTYQVVCTLKVSYELTAPYTFNLTLMPDEPWVITEKRSTCYIGPNEFTLARITVPGDYLLEMVGTNLVTLYDSRFQAVETYTHPYSSYMSALVRVYFPEVGDYYLNFQSSELDYSRMEKLTLTKTEKDIAELIPTAINGGLTCSAPGSVSGLPTDILRPSAFNFEVLYTDGTRESVVFLNLLGINQVIFDYLGDYSSDTLPVVLHPGIQPAAIHYFNRTSICYFPVKSFANQGIYSLLKPGISDEFYFQYNAFSGTQYPYRVQVPADGTYGMWVSEGFNDWIEEFNVRMFDRYNNEVPTLDGKANWPLLKGQEYTLLVYTKFDSSLDHSFNFGLQQTGSLPGSNYLPSPYVTSVKEEDYGLTLQWDPVAGAAQYRVYYMPGTTWTLAGTTSDTSFHISGLAPGHTYRFTVRCVNAANTVFTSNFDHEGWLVTYWGETLNLQTVARLYRAYMGEATLPEGLNPDFNGSGRFDLQDIALLFYLIVSAG